MELPARPVAADSPAGIDALTERARRLRQADPQQALALAREAVAAALRIDYQRGLAIGLLRLALSLQALAIEPEESLAHLQQCLCLFDALGDEVGAAEAANLLANTHATRNDHELALDLYQRSLVARRRLGDRAGEAGALNNMGLVHRRMAQFPEALKHLLMSLEVAEAAGDEHATACALCNIGGVLADLGDTTHALQYQLRGLALIRRTGDPAREGLALCCLGRLLAQTGHHAEALEHLRAALRLAQRGGRLADTGEALLGLAQVHQARQEHARAERLLLEALELVRRSGSRLLEAEVLLALGRTRWLQGDGGPAVALLEHGLGLAQALRADHVAGRLHHQLSQVHEQAERHAAALQAFQAFHACQQRISGQESQRRIRALLGRAELERAHRDAEHQRQRGDELESALSSARESEREKQALLAQLARQSESLQQLAREDGLTGLANRRWLDAQWAHECERARRYRHAIAVGMIDIDHFKSINDRFSHRVGDEVLRRVARLLRDAFRRGDIVGRYGGEEFMVAWVETPLEQAVAVCHKLRQRVAALPLGDLHPDLKSVTVSIGVAGCDADPVDAELVARADGQLYRAKAEGRNRVCW
ncbi:MAG: diguanylate cyclase [Pseudomonadota bacterium]